MPTTPILRGWTAQESPFHSGELAVQDRLGVRARIDSVARRAGIRDYMPDQHRQFFNEQSFLLMGAADAAGQPWPTLLVGHPGFITTPDAQTLHIDAAPPPHSPLYGQLHTSAFVGMLGIQFATGRRNRANGVLTAIRDNSLTMAVRQSYGNCRKYIQPREPSLIQGPSPHTARHFADTDRLSKQDQDLLSRCETFFVASAYFSEQEPTAQGADVSHRGGQPGFVRVDNAQTLTFPDYTGNFLFNTIGNLIHNPRAGLLFIDFQSSDLLYIAGSAHIIWDGPEISTFAGAQRLIQFHLHAVRRVASALPIRWS